MSSTKKKTIKSMAFALAAQQGYTLDEKNYMRFYRKILRHGGGNGSKFFIAYRIADMFIISQRPIDYSYTPTTDTKPRALKKTPDYPRFHY